MTAPVSPAAGYTAQAASPHVNGEVQLTIGENALVITALFDAAELPYAEITALRLADSVVAVKADSGEYAFSKLGNWCGPFYDALCDAYNKAVLRALFVKGSPILTARGHFRDAEDCAGANAAVPIHVYEDSVVALPPDLGARRVPLCFVGGMDKGDYDLTLKLDTGEAYTYAKLGYDTAAFAGAVETQIRALREASLAAVKELDPSLSVAQAAQLAKLMPQGAAVSFGRLAAIAPTFAAALEAKLADTRAAESYRAFKELCDPAKIYVGFRKNEAPADGGQDEAAPPDPYLLWLIAPSPDGQFAAVEFAQADAATFLYRTGGDFDGFACRLNRALEAIRFRREVIGMADEELRKPENADYAMAAKRTAALRFVRAGFAGRLIHSDMGTWRRKLTALWSGDAAAAPQDAPARTNVKSCGQCGAVIAPDAKFCGSCGART